MRRRDFLSVLGASAYAALPPGGCALLIDIRTGRILTAEGSEAARRWLVPPGSTIKPFSLLALLDAHKLNAAEEFLCPGRLTLAGRSLHCSHPYVAVPMNAARAIAYSCNCAVAHFAARFETGELSQYLLRSGIHDVDALTAGPPTQLQALGETGIEATPLELVAAYRHLATRADPQRSPILEGLEDAVAFGTAHAAALPHLAVAGKTGSVMTRTGARAAWFAGFAPSRTPEVGAVVLLQGRSGGADAAPIAHSLFETYFAGRA